MMSPVTQLIINGQPTPCISGKQIPLVDPKTGKEWLTVDEAGEEDVELAVHHAEGAWKGWNALPAYLKAATLRKYAEIILANVAELAENESKSIGRSLASVQNDVFIAVAMIQYFASVTETDQSQVSTLMPGHLNYVLRSPFGVTAAITPWNVPMPMFALKVAAAVGAGNSIILKSSEKAPLTSLMLGNLAKDAGFPPGLIQVLSGYGPTVGAALASHMKVRKISFTGSPAIGRRIQELSAKSNLKNVTLELGGKNPNIVFSDADLKSAAKICAHSLLSLFGQACLAATRIYVQNSVKDKFLEYYKVAFQQAKLDDATDHVNSYIPMIDRLQFERVKGYLRAGKEEGNALIGGEALEREGYFIEPTILVDVADDAKINNDEVFGPVVVIHGFETEEEVIRRANDSEYGLYGAVFTKDIQTAMRLSVALDVGNVGINCTGPTSSLNMPFGGYKQSGVGRELGLEGFRAWQEVKSVYLKYGDDE